MNKLIPGIQVIFSLDLMRIPCLFQARGEESPISLSAVIGSFPVKVNLTSENSPSTTNGTTGERRFFYNNITITIIKGDEDLANSDFIEGRARYLLMEFQRIVIEVINRLVHYFKYKKRHPNLRQISEFDFLNQEQPFCNPVWKTLDGQSLVVSAEPITTGILSIPGVRLLQDDLFGITAFTTQGSADLQAEFSTGCSNVTLSAQLLSDAQNAALANNTRRAVLELAISIETFVKGAFFKQEKIAGAAFEYLEDKGRETIKVIELLDGVALYAFGESFKAVAPTKYQQIDYLFRCRNKIAHRGEAIYRDDGAVWNKPDYDQLRNWWIAAIEMFSWLQGKVDAIKAAN